MIVAELSVVPVGSGSSMEDTVRRVVQALETNGIRHKVGPLGATLEAESIDDVLAAVRDAHKAAAQSAPRIMTELIIDQRLDKEETAKSLASVHA